MLDGLADDVADAVSWAVLLGTIKVVSVTFNTAVWCVDLAVDLHDCVWPVVKALTGGEGLFPSAEEDPLG